MCYLAPFSFESLGIYYPYHWDCEPIYIYKDKTLYKMDYAIENNIIDKETVKYEVDVYYAMEYINSVGNKFIVII